MILDKNLLMAEALAVSGAAGTALKGDVIDLGAGQRNVFRGTNDLYLVLTVTTAFASAGAATVNFQLASDAQAAIATDGSATVNWQSGALAYTTLTAGRRFIIPLPNDPDPERYLGLLVVTGAATTTAGSVTAELTAWPPADYIAHADAVN